MGKERGLVAFDVGAESGRVMLGALDGGVLNVREIHRFPNGGINTPSGLYWDVLGIYSELKRGLARAIGEAEAEIRSVGIDTWGVDFGLLSSSGELLGNPHHYRDPRTADATRLVEDRIPLERVYDLTGVQFIPMNTLGQLAVTLRRQPEILEAAESFLMIPCLIDYLLTGMKHTERTVLSTSQLMDPRTRDWCAEVLDAVGIPRRIRSPLHDPGTPVGPLRADVVEEVGAKIDVIAPAQHDTASAVAAVPFLDSGTAFLSLGTWALLGIETTRPLITEKTRVYGFSNEGGVAGTTRFLKIMSGLWILQECRRLWERGGAKCSYEDLERAAEAAPSGDCLIDPDDEVFVNPPDMPDTIRRYCRRSNQAVPDSMAAITRCVLESLALNVRFVLERIEEVTERPLGRINVIGGGVRNSFLCRLIAEITGREVLPGPVEATAMGNMLVQAMCLGEVANLEDMRELVRRSVDVKRIEPPKTERWESLYRDRFVPLKLHGTDHQ